MTPTRRALPAPITSAAALDRGWTRSAQRHAVRTGRAARVRRTVLDVPGAADEPRWDAARRQNLAAARAAVLVSPHAVVSHHSAAIAWNLPTVRLGPTPCVTVPAGTPLRRIAQTHLHRAALPDDQLSVAAGLTVTSPARTVLDVAREHGVDAGVAAADRALREGLCSHAELEAAFAVCAHWPGRRAARSTLLSADPAAESVLESLSRLRIAAARLPRPRLQPDICDEYGRFLGRPDFYWDEFGVIGEADGNLKYERGQQAIVAERGRHEQFEDTGLIVVRWGWAATRDFEPVARRLRLAYARGALAGSPDRRWGVLRPRGSGLHSVRP